jgi:hypothetical protein
MGTRIKTILAAAALGVSLLAAPTLSAQDAAASPGAMMGQGGMMGMMGGMMSAMMNMTGMTEGMAGMMERCHEMMQAMGDHDHGAGRPNEQWRERAPSGPDERG